MRWFLRRRPRGRHVKGAAPRTLPLPSSGRARLGAAVTDLPSAPASLPPLAAPVAPPQAAAPLPHTPAPVEPAPVEPAPVEPPPVQPVPVPQVPAQAGPERVGPHVELGFRDGSHAALDPESEQALALAELAAALTAE